MSFNEKYTKIFELVKDDISETEKGLISALKLSPYINNALKDFLMKKSKRIRPLISFLYLRASGINPTAKLYDFQTAVEIIHNASLIHDDVIDDAETRRGKTAINKQFNNKTAILTGDYLLSIALRKLNSLNSPETITMCADTIEGMCQGEVNQYFNKFKITTLEEYLKKTEQKTAKLFQTAVCGSMLLSEKSDLSDAKNFSLNFGMAFQIRDDILNITQKDSLKPSQNDIENGIFNAPVIFAGETSHLNKGIEKSKSLLNNYIVKAENALENLEENQYKHAIRELLGILNHE